MTARPRRRALLGAVLVGVATVVGTAGCAGTAASAPAARVVVRVAASAGPGPVDVRLAQAEGAWRARRSLRSGESRTFAVPAGWFTLRVPGRCVLPAVAGGSTTVEIDGGGCALR